IADQAYAVFRFSRAYPCQEQEPQAGKKWPPGSQWTRDYLCCIQAGYVDKSQGDD
ncbi:MAG: hypothetical protein HRU15_08180, partial [Planctomycetes bacterium]|nr:hypothetical protein [Planctomycetota bacterium]